MKKILFLFLFLFLTFQVQSQNVTVTIKSGTSLPSVCTPGSGATALFVKRGANPGLYRCTSTNTWTKLSTQIDIDTAVARRALDTQSYSSFNDAVTAIGSISRSLSVTADSTCTGVLTIPAALHLEFTNQAKIVKGLGCTLSFLGNGVSGDPSHQIFSGFAFGEVKWLRPTTPTLRPEWWGARGDTVTVTDGSAVVGTNQITSVAANFTPADSGKFISLRSAGSRAIVRSGTCVINAGNLSLLTCPAGSFSSFDVGRRITGTGGSSFDTTIAVHGGISTTVQLSVPAAAATYTNVTVSGDGGIGFRLIVTTTACTVDASDLALLVCPSNSVSALDPGKRIVGSGASNFDTNITAYEGGLTRVRLAVSVAAGSYTTVTLFGEIWEGVITGVSGNTATVASGMTGASVQTTIPSNGTVVFGTDDTFPINSAREAGPVQPSGSIGRTKIKFFPKVYSINASVVSNAGIQIFQKSGITFEGEGMNATVIKVIARSLAGGGDFHVFRILESSDITIRDLTIDGSKLDTVQPNEQRHGIYLSASNRIDIDRIRTIDIRGDSIFFLGRIVETTPVCTITAGSRVVTGCSPAIFSSADTGRPFAVYIATDLRGLVGTIAKVNSSSEVVLDAVSTQTATNIAQIYLPVENVKVTNSYFIGSERSGIAHNGTLRNIVENYNYFADIKNSPIDFEPTSGIGPVNVQIIGNVMKARGLIPGGGLFTFGGFFDAPAGNFTIADNVVDGNSLFRHMVDGHVTGNRFQGDGGRVLDISGIVEDVNISKNVIVAGDATDGESGAIHVRPTYNSPPSYPKRLKITHNFIQIANANGGGGIVLRDVGDSMDVIGNTIRSSNPARIDTSGVSVAFITHTSADSSVQRCAVSPCVVRGLRIENNNIEDIFFGIVLSTNPTQGNTHLRGVSIIGNRFSHSTGANITGLYIVHSVLVSDWLTDLHVADSFVSAVGAGSVLINNENNTETFICLSQPCRGGMDGGAGVFTGTNVPTNAQGPFDRPGIGSVYIRQGTNERYFNFGTSPLEWRRFGNAVGIDSGIFASAILDFPSISAGSQAELTVPNVTGAVLGDRVIATASGAIESNLVPYAFVSSSGPPGVITLRLLNISTLSAVDPASRTWNFVIIKP